MLSAIQVSDINHADELSEAKRCVKAFWKAHPGKDYWGQVIALETRYPRKEHEEADKARILELFGVPLTGRLDVVTYMTQEVINKMYDKHQLELPSPGVYVVDWKSQDKTKKHFKEIYRGSPQLITYQIMAEELSGHDVKGAIAVGITRLKREVKFQYAFCPRPGTDEHRMVAEWVIEQEIQAQEDKCNISNCYEWNKPCHHLGVRCWRN
jgi:hypothetical protein